jgi:hypothetical protein
MLSAARVPPPPLVARHHVDMPVSTQAAWPATLTVTATESSAEHLPALPTAAPPCRLRPRRHVPRVAWSRVPPLRGGLFCQNFSNVVLFDISVGQLVSSVKNSCRTATEHGMHIGSVPGTGGRRRTWFRRRPRNEQSYLSSVRYERAYRDSTTRSPSNSVINSSCRGQAIIRIRN